MKKTQFILLTLLSVFALSCSSDPNGRAGFDTSFDASSTGECTLIVEDNSADLMINGNIRIDQGALRLLLTAPDDSQVLNDTLQAPQDTTINLPLTTMAGTWKLAYESLEGTGTINIHIEY